MPSPFIRLSTLLYTNIVWIKSGKSSAFIVISREFTKSEDLRIDWIQESKPLDIDLEENLHDYFGNSSFSNYFVFTKCIVRCFLPIGLCHSSYFRFAPVDKAVRHFVTFTGYLQEWLTI